jgi:hypothetical protein
MPKTPARTTEEKGRLVFPGDSWSPFLAAIGHETRRRRVWGVVVDARPGGWSDRPGGETGRRSLVVIDEGTVDAMRCPDLDRYYLLFKIPAR